MANVHRLSVLIPVLNEARTLAELMRRVLAVELPCEREVIVVDDGSTDGSRELAQAIAAREPAVRVFAHERRLGKGAALRTAITHATGDWAIVQDADLEYDPAEYPRLLLPAELGLADAVFGSRFATYQFRRVLYFWHTAANRFLTLCTNMATDLNLTDMETCYKLVRADILRGLRLRSSGFAIEPELTVKLALWGARIYEVPVSYAGRTYAEGKKIRARHVFGALWALLRFRFFDADWARDDAFLVLLAHERARRFRSWQFAQVAGALGDEVLEAGCGLGNLTRLLLDRRRLVCTDLDPLHVERVRRSFGHLSNVEVLRANLETGEGLVPAAASRPFDSALCVNVLEHIDADREAVRHLAGALKPGGSLVVLVPNGPGMFSGADRALGHRRRYTAAALCALAESAGLEVESCRGFNRLGGLGWRLSAWRSPGAASRSLPALVRIFDWLVPLARLVERVPFHQPISLVMVARRPAEKSVAGLDARGGAG